MTKFPIRNERNYSNLNYVLLDKLKSRLSMHVLISVNLDET